MTITWKEFCDLVAATPGRMLVHEDELGYMVLEKAGRVDRSNPDLWRNQVEGGKRRKGLLALQLYEPGSDSEDGYCLEFPPDLEINVCSTGTIELPYSFEYSGDACDWFNIDILGTCRQYPVRVDGRLVLRCVDPD